MESIKKYRIINTVVTAIGTLACIAAGFIPAPLGLLTDGRATIIQALPGTQKLVLFALPVILLVAAVVIVASGRYGIAALISVLAGSCLFAWMDLAFIQASQSFIGTLINEAGIIVAVAGVLLHVFGMPKSKSTTRIAEIVSETPDPVDDALLFGRQEDFYDGADDMIVMRPIGRDTMELRDTLVAALKAITETDEEDSLPSEDSDKAPDESEAEEPQAADPGRTMWSSDSELVALLRAGSKEIEATAAEKIPEIVTTEDISEAGRIEEADNETKKESITDFYAGLEEMFKSAE